MTSVLHSRPLQFERMAQLIAIASIPRNTQVNRSLEIKKSEISVSFSNYCKSQVHLNIVSDLCDRTFKDYVHANKFVQGAKQWEEDAKSVLRMFYGDMAKFLINNNTCVQLSIEVDGFSDLPVHEVDVDALIAQMLDLINSTESSRMYDGLRNFEYAEILDEVENQEEACSRIVNYAVAAVLSKAAENPILEKIKLRWSNEINE